MLTAYSFKLQKKIAATLAEKGDDVFFCSACGEELTLRKGLIKIHHFAHKSTSACQYKGETQLHLGIKKSIYISLIAELGNRVKNVELEYWLKGVRPDILVTGRKKQIAIEIQASSLTVKEVLFRTQKYYRLGIFLMWVLPFDHERFMVVDDVEKQFRSQLIRLKAYERTIMHLYFNNLIFWDRTEKFSKGFIVMKMAEVVTEASTFYSIDWGTVLTFSPKKLKTIKRVVAIKYDLKLSDFLPGYANKFKMPGTNYYLPRRLIVNYKWEKDNH